NQPMSYQPTGDRPRRWWIAWLIMIPVLAAGVIVAVRVVAPPVKLSVDQVEVLKPALGASLPADAKQAQAELQKARAALAKLKPAKKYIVIDTNANQIYYRTEDEILLKATCSTGSGGELVDSLSGRKWVFSTPKGVFKVNSKLVDPWWRKPDWAFVEDNEAIPKDERERYDPEMLGQFAMGFGNGYFIHGTIYQRLLGVSVTHGCVRVGDEDLKKLFDMVTVGTPVYVF
ncbi:MAG TPA: L,D-transpeptidase, partial [bacterium]|nr:L,D-transpeptidase [bacterium]